MRLDSSAKESSPRLTPLLVLLVTALALVSYVVGTTPAILNGVFGVNRFQDDAFYYIVTANNYLAHGRMAFDSVHVTNGFHPLWMAIIVSAMWVLGPGVTPEMQVLVVKALEKAALGAAVLTCLWGYVAATRISNPWRVGFAGALIVLLCPWYVVFDQGMETTLLVCLFLLSVHAFLREHLGWLAALLVLMFLCRLDAGVFVSLPLGAWVVLRGGASIRTRLLTILPLLLAMLLLTAWNWWTTGHTVPISGAIRSSFPWIRWHGSYFVEPVTIAQLYGWATFWMSLNVLLCAGVLATALVLIAVGLFEPRQREKAFVIGGVGGLLLLNLLLFQKWEKSVDPRYVALPMTIAVMVLFIGTQSVAERWAAGSSRLSAANWKLALPSLGLAGVLIAILATDTSQFAEVKNLRADPVQTLFRDIGKALPRSAIVAGTDVGALAFWTGRRVINLDGVINNYDYQSWVRDGRLGAYLRQEGVTHIATVIWDKPEFHTGRPPEPTYMHQLDPGAVAGADQYQCHPYYVYSHVYGRYSEKLCLEARSERFRRDVGKYGAARMVYLVYQLAP